MRVAKNGRGSWHRAAAQGRGNQGESPEEGAPEEGLRGYGIPGHKKRLCSLTPDHVHLWATSFRAQILTTSLRSPDWGVLIKAVGSWGADLKEHRSLRALGSNFSTTISLLCGFFSPASPLNSWSLSFLSCKMGILTATGKWEV